MTAQSFDHSGQSRWTSSSSLLKNETANLRYFDRFQTRRVPATPARGGGGQNAWSGRQVRLCHRLSGTFLLVWLRNPSRPVRQARQGRGALLRRHGMDLPYARVQKLPALTSLCHAIVYGVERWKRGGGVLPHIRGRNFSGQVRLLYGWVFFSFGFVVECNAIYTGKKSNKKSIYKWRRGSSSVEQNYPCCFIMGLMRSEVWGCCCFKSRSRRVQKA